MHWELNSEVRWLTGRPETKREVRLGEGEREGDKKGEGREGGRARLRGGEERGREEIGEERRGEGGEEEPDC